MSGEVAVLGVGMHPWGKWGRNFVEYGVHAARAALKDSGVRWRDIQFVSGRRDDALRLSGLRRRRNVCAGARLAGCRGQHVVRGVCVRLAGARGGAREDSRGRCDVALVVGADTTPKGFLAPAKGYRPDDPDWVRFHIGITNPTYFALYARRRMALYGATEHDFAAIKVKNAAAGAANPNARYRKKFTLGRSAWRRRWSPTRCGCSRSARPPTAARPSCCRASSTRASSACAIPCRSPPSRP